MFLIQLLGREVVGNDLAFLSPIRGHLINSKLSLIISYSYTRWKGQGVAVDLHGCPL